MLNSSEDVAMNKLYTEDDAACVGFYDGIMRI